MKGKIFSILMGVCLLAGTVLSCAACGASGASEYDLTVTYYKGGYGSDWIEHSAAEFEKEYDVQVQLISSSSLDCGAYTYLKLGRNLSDIYICASSSWESWVSEGLIADLTDVYEGEAQTEDGPIKVKDYIDSEVIDKFYMERRPGTGEYLPWAMPWSVNIKALVYNVDILEQVTHVSDISVDGLEKGETWTAPPATMSELKAYFEDVVAYDNGRGEIVPFGWTGNNPEGFFNFLYPVWAQYQGVEESNVPDQGSYYDFWNVGNTVAVESSEDRQTISLDGFDQDGLAVAFDMLIDLIVENGQYVNGLPDASSLTPQELQKTIVANSVDTNCAVALGSSYLEYEAGNNGFLDSDKDGERDYRIAFMAVPAIEGYEGEDILYTPVSDVMFIPAQADHIELAKSFLIFLCNQDQLEYFTTSSGSIRPFNYDPLAIEGAEYSDFTKSVFNIYYDSIHLMEYPKGIARNQVSYVYRYEKIKPIGTTSINTVYSDLRTKTGEEIMSGIKQNLINLNLNNWITRYHLVRTDD